ncbi:MAG: type I pantothenate kinase [Candidatus Malihini olakiniferum]
MKDREQHLVTPYLQFDRRQWAALRNTVPLKLNEDDIFRLKEINNKLSFDEIAEIYLPLSRLLNFYISSSLRHQAVLEQFLGINRQRIPYIIGIAGSVAVGKSTTARVLQTLLSCWPEHRRVELITTDNFLYSKQVLKARNLIQKKGFPESYDSHNLMKFLSKIKSGAKKITAPIYSHLTYDIIPKINKVVEQPDILILEGLNVLQRGMNYSYAQPRTFISDFIDFSIYIDAAEDLLKSWYINRFLEFRKGALFSELTSYFNEYTKLTEEQSVTIAKKVWRDINEPNLHQNILPTREHASLILTKRENHAVAHVLLKREVCKII